MAEVNLATITYHFTTIDFIPPHFYRMDGGALSNLIFYLNCHYPSRSDMLRINSNLNPNMKPYFNLEFNLKFNINNINLNIICSIELSLNRNIEGTSRD